MYMKPTTPSSILTSDAFVCLEKTFKLIHELLASLPNNIQTEEVIQNLHTIKNLLQYIVNHSKPTDM